MVNTEKLTSIHEKNGTNQKFTNSPFNFFLSVHCVLSFQLNVSFPFIAPFLSFRLFLSMRYFCPFVPCLIFRSLLLPIRFNSSCRFNSSFPFIASFLSFHLFPTMRYFRPLVSSLISRSFLLPSRFNSSLPFASVLPSDLILPVSSQLFLSVRCVLSFIPSLLFHLLPPFFRINSYVLFVSFFLPFQLFLSIRCVCAFIFLSFQFSSSICYFLSFA